MSNIRPLQYCAHGLYRGRRNTMHSAACLKMQLTAQCALGLTENFAAAEKKARRPLFLFMLRA